MRLFCIVGICLLLIQDDYKEQREKMVENQIEARGIDSPLILEAMRNVERHKLVPESYREYSYTDSPLPIGNGQTISQPYIVAYMSVLLQPLPTMKVLEIGTGSGYQAAVLAEIVKEVYTVEIVEILGKKAEKAFEEMGYENIHVRIGDGYKGWAENAPYDAIIVTAAAPEIPQPLVDQLKEGGRMIIPLGSSDETQELVLVEKTEGKITTNNLLPVRFVPFTRDTL